MIIDLFLDYLRLERNYSECTVKSYGADLRLFESFFTEMDERLTWKTVDADVIRLWMVQMMDEETDRGDRAATVNRRLSCLRSFYRFLVMRGEVDANPASKVTGPKRKKKLPYFMKEAEMDKLLDGDLFEPGFEGTRDRTILDFFYSTGVRLAELVSLDDGDVDYSASCVKVTGKRNKQRLIPFGDELKAQLDTYIRVRNEVLPSRDSNALFVQAGNGERITPALVYKLVRENLSKVTTMKKRSPHVLRHTFATTMLNHSAELGAVKELLGHSSLAATEVYTHTTFEELKQIYKHAHPRA